MITLETPLPEVARLLGAGTAIMVDRQDFYLQTVVLIAVRSYMIHLQYEPDLESQVDFDPITFQEKVHKFVDSFLMAYKGQYRA